MSKVFRVLISETQGFYVDIEATSPEDAMSKVRAGINSGDVVPIEYDNVNSGYQIDHAEEINREDADLQ